MLHPANTLVTQVGITFHITIDKYNRNFRFYLFWSFIWTNVRILNTLLFLVTITFDITIVMYCRNFSFCLFWRFIWTNVRILNTLLFQVRVAFNITIVNYSRNFRFYLFWTLIEPMSESWTLCFFNLGLHSTLQLSIIAGTSAFTLFEDFF